MPKCSRPFARVRRRQGMPSLWLAGDRPGPTFPGDTGDVYDRMRGTAAGVRSTPPSGSGVPVFSPGSGLYFPGSSGVNYPIPAWIKTPTITLGARFTPTSLVSYEKVAVLDYRANGTWNIPYVSWSLTAQTGATGHSSFDFTVAGTLYSAVGTSTIVANVQRTLFATYDGFYGRLYVNGSLEASVSITGSIDYGTSGTAAIGCESFYAGSNTALNGESLHGYLDYFLLDTKAWSAAKILAWTNAPYSALPPPSRVSRLAARRAAKSNNSAFFFGWP